MSKLTAKKIKKCREYIKAYKRYKKFIEERDNKKYRYSELINSVNHIGFAWYYNSYHC